MQYYRLPLYHLKKAVNNGFLPVKYFTLIWNMKYIHVLISVLFFSSYSFAQQNVTGYKIYDVKNKKLNDLDQLITAVKGTDVVIFGEEHNDSVGHLLETEIFKKMMLAYPGTALSMEMFSTDVQPVINEYLSGMISEKNFIKEARAWNNYTDYKPLIELAKTNKAAVIAANVATRYSNAVTFGGLQKLAEFPAVSKAYFPPLPVDTATGRYLDKFLETLGGHDMGNMKIYQTQNLWDASMAWSIARYTKANPGKKLLQLNGRFHSDEKLGTVAQLKKYAPKLKVLNISCFAGADFAEPDWEKYQLLGDYIILTAPAVKK
jgi:uncharacterized iron-regulated protein